MKMKRCTAAILLLLSLEALIAGRPSAAVADDGVDTIRLPSHGLADEIVTAAEAREKGDEKKMPWKCCDVTDCTRSIPPACRCMDPVERCDEACKNCTVSKTDHSKRVCADRYRGFPPARCTKPGNDVPGGGRCKWPNCINNGDGEEAATEGTRLLNSTSHVSNGKAEAAASEKSVADGDEQGRPWKCCDDTLCTRSAPPTCQCLDKVKKCAKTCKSCEKADKSNGASSRFVCLDRYFGWPGPKCGKSGAADVARGN